VLSVMLPFGIFFTPNQEFFVEFTNVFKTWYRHQHVSPVIADLVLHIAFFMPGIYIAEYCFETVMLHETHEIICQVPASALYYLSYYGAGIIKPYPWRHSTYVLKYRLQALEQAFLVLSLE